MTLAANLSHEAEQRLLTDALARIQPHLQRLDNHLLAQLSDPLAQRVVYLVSAGGKRLRPALVLLTGFSGPSPDDPGLLDAAAAVELIHTATLLHDDIIDLAHLRRRQPAFHERWGAERALLTGDYLYATAFQMLGRIGAPGVVQVMADVCQQLSRGELLEVEARHRLDLSEREYFAIIQGKTASLIEGCCRCGSLLGSWPQDAVEHLAAFGLQFGLAFQIIDDCLDLIGDPDRLGKSVHADLDKGVLSLPMIYTVQRLPAARREALFAPVRDAGEAAAGVLDPRLMAEIAAAAKACGAIESAQERARQLLDASLAPVQQAGLGDLARACEGLARYALHRTS